MAITRIIVFLLLLSGSGAIFAAEDPFDVANVDKTLLLRKKTAVILPPSVTEKYEYYEIKGEREKDLKRQMGQNGVSGDDGKKYDSLTTWRLSWNYGYDLTPQACTADSFRANVEIIFRYPKWVRPDASGDAPGPLVEKWSDYMKRLVIHENGHRDIAVEAAAGLSRAVAALPPARSCAELDRQVLALCRVHLKKLNEDEQKYDAATRHGYTQGAVFP